MNQIQTVRILSLLLLVIASGCGTSPPPQPPAFDVPSLIGKNIDEVKVSLGAPADDDETDYPATAGRQSHSKNWERAGNKELMVEFYKDNRQIVDFFVSCDDTSGACEDKDHLMQIGNLSDGDSRYRLEFVPAGGQVGKYTGVKITPN